MEWIEALAFVLSMGAGEYGEHKWLEEPHKYSEHIDALTRHLNAFKQGEDFDDVQRQHHLASVAVRALMLMSYTIHKDDLPEWIDDRRDPGPARTWYVRPS